MKRVVIAVLLSSAAVLAYASHAAVPNPDLARLPEGAAPKHGSQLAASTAAGAPVPPEQTQSANVKVAAVRSKDATSAATQRKPAAEKNVAYSLDPLPPATAPTPPRRVPIYVPQF